MGEVPTYNAANFNFGVDQGGTTTLAYATNSTVFNLQIKAFLCPSDPNAGITVVAGNNYYGCVGTTTYLNNANTNIASLANLPTSGLFGFQYSIALRECLDGASNTVALSEAVVGEATQAFKQKNVGLRSVTGIPAAAEVFDASSNPTATLQGINACTRAWSTGSGGAIDTQRGKLWSHGAIAQTLFNTVVPPNGQQFQWTHCSDSSSTSLGNYSNADSFHAGGVNTLFADGSVRFIKESIDQRTWWALGTKAGGEVVGADSY
jgi:prepilin-type processing-associated H-X9-DG protein